MPAPSDYFLSDDENAAIFEQQIRHVEFGRFGNGLLSTDTDTNVDATTDRPVCIILAGQTGAGKSHTAPALAAALTRAFGGVCHLVADTHKPYHPAYAGLVADAAAGKVPPGLASAATGHDARRWLAKACAVAAGGSVTVTATRERLRLPTLVESASRYPGDVVEMAGIFRRAGYHVCLVLLAVHAAQSRLGLLARYLDAPPPPQAEHSETTTMTQKKLPVRLTPRRIHDESYAGLAELAHMLDDGTCPADALLILRRGCRVAYTNYCCVANGADGTSVWETAPPGVGRALEAERARCTSAELLLFASDVVRLHATHPERADELDAMAAEAAAAVAVAGGEAATEDADALSPLDADALVARLRRDW